MCRVRRIVVSLVVMTPVTVLLLTLLSRCSILVIVPGILMLILCRTRQALLPMFMNIGAPQCRPLPNSWTILALPLGVVRIVVLALRPPIVTPAFFQPVSVPVSQCVE